MPDHTTLPANTNQARGIAEYAIAFLSDGERQGQPDQTVLDRTLLFYIDAALCGASALALKTNAPTVLRNEALGYPLDGGATCFGSAARVQPEKAIAANCAAVREWDSNGTNFGYNPARNQTAGEFGHNDFYSVITAAAQQIGTIDGKRALLAMVCHDEIRGRLAEAFSLKSYKIDHVLHGAVASAAVYGALVGATPDQIESAIGMVVAHAVPFRAIRAGKQLSDSKGSSAAVSTEFAVLSVKRSIAGFLGPRDIFRNPEAVYRIFEGPGQMAAMINADGTPKVTPNTQQADASPFDLYLSTSGTDFTIMGMHFKLGLYEHQSAGAIHAVIDLLTRVPTLLNDATGTSLKRISITAYEPAFGIIGDPAKRTPTTRQSADHSMVYIIATLVRKALENKSRGADPTWKDLILGPHDYAPTAIDNALTKAIMDKIDFAHGGKEYDDNYPDGIPTKVEIEHADGTTADSGMVLYPAGHARNTDDPLIELLDNKWQLLSGIASDQPEELVSRFRSLPGLDPAGIADLHNFAIAEREPIDGEHPR